MAVFVDRVAWIERFQTLSGNSDSGIVMVDGTIFGDSFEQDRSWDDSGTTISGI